MGRWQTQVLLIHGVHTPFLWFGVLAGRLRGLTVVPVLTDPPGVAGSDDGVLIKVLRRVDARLVRLALARCDGVVALTQALADDFAPGRPCLVMDGILNAPSLTTHNGHLRRDTFDIAYAGGLTRAYGVDRLVEAVRAMHDPRVRLRIFGRGELDGWLREQASMDGRIQPPEFLEQEDLARELSRADVLVNPRPADQDFVKYSFPSKVIEYLSMGVPIVTTRLAGIPADYEGRLVFAESDTVEGLRGAISRVLAMPGAEAHALGEAGAEFVRVTRGAQAQGARLRRFLHDLLGYPSRDRLPVSKEKT
jgi:glycosyltransferase involved in cell wall biosynthesis